ncbi:TdeIII family type II restriction endonuclease [Flavobacterium soyangense]|uniref:type II site-specific deoxyribonuclease n=1 Tax=Flavobacterium soyangense TaxID=2023265 RepID=A0A930UDT5_9FLAO|nr:TdeIII family type II restriction endonuclease [Flavobacterium soyangense]MBF2709032.1 TdeIII family type II restriction endonuclease [Flavobacterium soyangense]
MSKEERVALAIKNVVSKMMDRVLENVLYKNPFEKEVHRANKPLYAALVPDEIFKGSHFERRFVTPFGGVWEKLAQVVAIEAHGNCSMGHSVNGIVGSESLRRIQEVLNKLEHNKKGELKIKPDWETELKYIQEGGGNPIPVSVTCDVFIHNETTNIKYAFELKGPLPNSDQTKVSKEKMFKLLAMNPKQVDFAYYALPYNPYGKKEEYKWTFPLRWFNMQSDSSVLIGNEFWELIGGKGTYNNFIKEVNLLGATYRERIYREFLEMEPPLDFEEVILK